jgi:phasin family protein
MGSDKGTCSLAHLLRPRAYFFQSSCRSAAGKDFAEQNVTTTFDHAQKLVQAKDAQTLLTLHGEFVQSQMQMLTEQARILGEVSSKTAMDAAKSKS